MTRDEALKLAGVLFCRVAEESIGSYSNAQKAEMAGAWAEAGKGLVELAKELGKDEALDNLYEMR